MMTYRKINFLHSNFNSFFLPFLILVVVEDREEPTNNLNKGMGSKSMDSINSYGNGADDQGDDIEKARLISQVLGNNPIETLIK